VGEGLESYLDQTVALFICLCIKKGYTDEKGSAMSERTKSMSWMPLYVNDWLGSKTTLTMSNEQRGAYIQLLIWQWQSDDNAFESIEEMNALCGLDLTDPKHAKLLAKFQQPDGLYNDKARAVYHKQREQFDKMSNGGRKGGLKGGLKGGVKQPEPKPEPTKITTTGATSDADFWSELKSIYTWIDVEKEQAKMRAWFLTPRGKKRKLTRAFAVNWLNKVDKPLDDGISEKEREARKLRANL
jgi:hypothetical protein